MKKVFNKINYYSEKFKHDHLSEFAAECAYYTILSFIPFIIICLSLIKYINLDINQVYKMIFDFFPTSVQELTIGIVNEVYAKSVGTISFAIIIAFWSASKGFYSLCKGIRHIYNTKSGEKPNIFIRFEGILYTIVFILLLISVLIFRVFGNIIYDATFGKFYYINKIVHYGLKFRLIVMIFVLFMFFVLLYKLLSRSKEKLLNQILGALFSSFGWYILSWGFSLYVNLFKNFSITYGSLTSIILVLMWVYACMYVILLGAEINVIFKDYLILKNDNNIEKKTKSTK